MRNDDAARFLAEHDHYREDLAYWRAAADRLGGPVLDVGAAAGRVAVHLARAGHAVWALDASPAMLDALRRALEREEPVVRERVTPVLGDMRDPRLGRAFPLVVVPMNTLQVLVEPGDRVRCLRALADHVAPGGELLFDVAMPDAEEIVETMGRERDGGVHRYALTGESLRHSAWYDAWEPATRTLEFTLRIRARGREGEREALRHHRVHLFTPGEVTDLVQEAGLEHVEVLGDFDGGPLGPWSERQVHRCRRPV